MKTLNLEEQQELLKAPMREQVKREVNVMIEKALDDVMCYDDGTMTVMEIADEVMIRMVAIRKEETGK